MTEDQGAADPIVDDLSKTTWIGYSGYDGNLHEFEPPIGWRQAAINYRSALHKALRRGDELQRKLSRRSIDDVYLFLFALTVATVLMVVLL